ncbi:MAG: ATP-binding cassette domain-containing protein [Candidatus Bathyarchaeota archaeon]|nr:ATP-binding cassette domain-containing protein [Candidatus Bathyarchaeota archaeon]
MEFAIDVENLTRVFEGKTRALDGVNLRIESGKIFALIGPNGAGKTTLMRILTTQIEPTSGEAHVLGLDVVKHGAEIRKLIGYIPQEMSVWTDISGYENLLIYAKIYDMASRERRRVINDALKDMGLIEFKDNLVRTYSGGMIRRLEIACAMLIKPQILFLDEPTIGLDPSARNAVWEKLVSFKSEYSSTVFFNTHYMDEADLYSDEIAIINRGKIVTMGTAEALKHCVGGEIIRLSMEGNSVSEDFLEKVRKLNVANEVVVNDLEVDIGVGDAETALPQVMEVLRTGHVSVKKISLTKPSLDDVFVKYAGTRLESIGTIREVKEVRDRIRR